MSAFSILRDSIEAGSYGQPFGDPEKAVSAIETAQILALVDIAEAAQVLYDELLILNEEEDKCVLCGERGNSHNADELGCVVVDIATALRPFSTTERVSATPSTESSQHEAGGRTASSSGGDSE